MSHVPGPWTVHGDNHTLIGCDDRKMMLAEVLWEHVVTEWSRPLAEAQANARLIAAAPDLLKALRELVAEFDRYDAAMTKIGRGHEDYGWQRRDARTAIAKAEGRA
jgi:hypothetical protein